MLVARSLVVAFLGSTLALAAHDSLASAGAHNQLGRRQGVPKRVECTDLLDVVLDVDLDVDLNVGGLLGIEPGLDLDVGQALKGCNRAMAAQTGESDDDDERKEVIVRRDLSKAMEGRVQRFLNSGSGSLCVDKTRLPQLRKTVEGESRFVGVSTQDDCEVKCGSYTGPSHGPTNFVAVSEGKKTCWCFNFDAEDVAIALAASRPRHKCVKGGNPKYIALGRTDFDRSQSQCTKPQLGESSHSPSLFVPGLLRGTGSCGSSCFKANASQATSTKVLEYNPKTKRGDWDTPIYRCERHCATYTTFPAYELFGLIGQAQGKIACSCFGKAQANYRHKELVAELGASVDQAKCDQAYGSLDGEYMTVQQAEAWVDFGTYFEL